MVVCLFLGLVLTGCAGGNSGNVELTPVSDDVLSIQLSSKIQTVDPAYVQSQGELLASRLVFSGLVKSDYGQMVGDLADSWSLSADGLVYTFTLKPDIYFHDGTLLTTDDIKFSWERVLRLNAPSGYIFNNIVGADEVISGQSKTLSGIVLISDMKMEVHLKTPQSTFLSYLKSPAAAALQRIEIVEQGENFGKAGTIHQAYALPSGTGPFCLSEWIDGKSLTLGLNDPYFDKTDCYPERIELTLDETTEEGLNLLVSKRVDIVYDYPIDENPFGYDLGKYTKVSEPIRMASYLAMNNKIAPFDNINLRKAIFAMVSAKDVSTAARGNYVTSPYYGISDYWYQLDKEVLPWLESSPEIDAYLQAAGYPLGQGVPALTLLCSQEEDDILAANSIAAAMGTYGITVHVEPITFRDLRRALRSGEAVFYLGGYVDKGSGLDGFFSEVADANNQSVINVASYQAILQQAYLTNDQAAKQMLYKQAETVFQNDGVLQVLYFKKSAMLLSKQWQNLKLDSDGALDFSAYGENSDDKAQ